MSSLIQLAIADDDAEQASNLKVLVTRLRPSWVVLPVSTTLNELRQTLDDLVPDILLLDLHMPGLSQGTSSLDVVRVDNVKPVVVLITGDPTYALQAYERAVSDYIVKPVRPSRLDQALRRAEAMLPNHGKNAQLLGNGASSASWIAGSRGRDVVLVNPEDILYLQADRKYTTAFIEGGQVLLRKGITEIEALLDSAKFVRVHRGTIVNVARVDFLRRDEMGRLRIHLKKRSDSLIVSRSFEQVFKEY